MRNPEPQYAKQFTEAAVQLLKSDIFGQPELQHDRYQVDTKIVMGGVDRLVTVECGLGVQGEPATAHVTSIGHNEGPGFNVACSCGWTDGSPHYHYWTADSTAEYHREDAAKGKI